jgi:hypothetical protein
VRFSVLVLLAALVGCNRGASNDAIRQAVIDYLSSKKDLSLNIQAMDVAVTSVQQSGSDADAAVMISPKGAAAAQGMSFKYHLQQRGNAWMVVGSAESGAAHGGMAAPAEGNPHGGAPPATPGGAEKMPDPSALPPASPKK